MQAVAVTRHAAVASARWYAAVCLSGPLPEGSHVEPLHQSHVANRRREWSTRKAALGISLAPGVLEELLHPAGNLPVSWHRGGLFQGLWSSQWKAGMAS